MTKVAALAALFSSVTSLALAQPAGSPPPPPPPPPPPAYAPAPVASPPPGAPAPAPAAEPTRASTREPVELHVLLGPGSAVCDNDKPDSDCPVDGGVAFGLGGGWRFHDHFSAGLELAAWSFKVRDEWRGQLQNEATDVKFSSSYLALFARWYWFEPGNFNPYLQAGIGVGRVTAEAENDNAKYTYSARGLAYPLAIGAEWQLAKVFRLGPQFGAYLHVSNELCEETGGTETCRSPGKDEDGNKEGLALPWRLAVVGTFTFGS